MFVIVLFVYFSDVQVLHINFVLYGKIRKDASMCPVVRWDAYEIRRFMKWLDK